MILICSKKGFTLVELMVVIAIIGILSAALLVPITNARSAGRSVRCKTNLRNLAQAAHSYAVDTHSDRHGVRTLGERLPSAGTYERRKNDSVSRLEFDVYLGWVSGFYGGPFPWPAVENPRLGRSSFDSMASYSFFGDNREAVFQSITNGVLWDYVRGDLSTYVCDEHKTVAIRAKCKNVLRSYVMNAYFGWELPSAHTTSSASTPPDREVVRRLDRLSERGNAGTLLLFAELPAYNAEGAENIANNQTDPKTDGVLHVEIKGYYTAGRPGNEEIIGFNHRTAKRMVAHVAFTDGHVDAIVAPDRATRTDLQNLTFLLCNGLEVPARKEDWGTARTDFK